MILPDSFSLQSPLTAIIVDRYYGNTKGRTLQSRDKNWLLGKWGGNNGCFMEGWISSGYPSTSNIFTISTATLEGTSPKWYVDGVLKGNAGGTASPGRLGFCKNGGTYSGEVSEADIACVLIYNRVLTDDERQKVETWLAYQYGISVTPDLSQFAVASAIDVNNADGTGNKIFQLSVWGKTSRSAKDTLKIEGVTQKAFADLGSGWYQASGQFMVPDSVAMVRGFEINKVSGAWDSLEVRKHRIRMISDAITQATFTDPVTLTTLADQLATAANKLSELELKETEEAALLKEKKELEEKLILVADLPTLRVKRDNLNTEVNGVNGLKSKRDELNASYESAKLNPFNYYYTISEEHTRCHVGFISTDALWLGSSQSPASGDGEWKFVAVGDSYYIQNQGKYISLSVSFFLINAVELFPIFVTGNHDENTFYQRWKILPQGYDKYRIHFNDYYIYTPYGSGVYNLFPKKAGARDGNYDWTITKSDRQSNNVIGICKEAFDTADKEYSTKNAEL